MKKKIAFITALVLTALSVPAAVSAADFAQGDVDMDGIITGRDSASVSQYADGVLKLDLTDEQLSLADMNGDGTADAADAGLIYEQQEYPLGDVTQDGFLNLSDVAPIAWMYIYSEDEFKEVYGDMSRILADVDCDGDVDVDDRQIAISAYAKAGTGLDIWVEGGYYYAFDHVECYDFDEDDKFSLDDAVALLDAYAQEAAGLGNARLIIMSVGLDADVNRDGNVDLDDVGEVVKAWVEDAAGL